MGTYADTHYCQICPVAEQCDHYDFPDLMLQCREETGE